MRIAQVVTLVTEDGAYGGPVSVARAQAVELARRGHEVTLLAGWDGRGVVDVEESGVKVELFRTRVLVPGIGFPGLVAPGLAGRLRNGRGAFDLVHVHLARDAITLPAARAARRSQIRYVVQTHGMVRPDGRLRARATDRVATRRVLVDARTVFALTELEESQLRRVAGPQAHIRRLTNGVATGSVAMDQPRAKPADQLPDVLFCARLHPRKRVLAFAEMAVELGRRGVEAQFSVVGPDEGDLEALRGRIASTPLLRATRYEGALPPHEVSRRLAAADVYVLPSVSEPFPMTVLEAMAQCTPVVLTDTCGIAVDLADRGAALVTDGSPTQLADAVQRILTDPATAAALRANASDSVRDRYGIAAVVDTLEAEYEAAVSSAAN